jgi:hypothetical protein
MLKQRFPLFVIFLIVIVFQSCIVSNTHGKKAPPGQAKKVTGSQSAKPYAPGQQKKKH